MIWSGSESEPKEEDEVTESQELSSSRSGRFAGPGKHPARGRLHYSTLKCRRRRKVYALPSQYEVGDLCHGYTIAAGVANAITPGASPPDAMDGQSAPRDSADPEVATTQTPESSSMGSSPRRHTRASRKRPLTDAGGSDAEDAAADVPGAQPAAAVAAPALSRRVHVPSRPSSSGSTARPPGRAALPEVRGPFIRAVNSLIENL